MAELKLYKSNSKGYKVLAASLAFVLIGCWMISKEPLGSFDYVMGWICAIFFGLGIIVGLFTVFDNRPQIIINENSVWDRTLKQNEIKWEQINGAYLNSISDQKFISIAVDETYEFRKKQAKWVGKFNELIGVEPLNLNLSQIKTDENKLTLLINKLSVSEKNERNNLIRAFHSNERLNRFVGFQKNAVIFLTAACIIAVLISINKMLAFWVIIGTTGISAVISKWYRGSDNNSKLRFYAEKITYIGFISMVLLWLCLEIYDYCLK